MAEDRVKELETLVYCLLQREYERDRERDNAKRSPFDRSVPEHTFNEWKSIEMRKMAYYQAREQNRVGANAEEQKRFRTGTESIEPFCLSFQEWEEYQREKTAYEATLVGRILPPRMQQPFPRMIHWKREKMEKEETSSGNKREGFFWPSKE